MKKFIARLRQSANFSQEELAERLGISLSMMQKLESGQRDITLSEVKKIAQIFDLPVSVIIDDAMEVDEKIEEQHFSERMLERFHQLVLHCVKYGAGKDGKITKTKLAKLVYLCDFAYYYHTLTPISGFEYKKLAQGPVAIEFFDIIDSDTALAIEEKDRALLISLTKEPQSEVFTGEELAFIQAVCTKWRSASTQEIVEFTHQQIPWKVCREREVIPYSLINNEAPENVY